MGLSPRYPVATERLLLRPLGDDDVDALLAYHARADVHRYLPMATMDAETITRRIHDGPWSRTTLDAPGQSVVLGVALAAGGELVGDVMLLWVSENDKCGEVGYVLDPRHGGHGYATEAVAALLRLGFEDLGLHRIIARIDTRNARSLGVARRLGMREEGRFVESVWNHDEWVDLATFAILEHEWRAAERSPLGTYG